MNIYKDYLFSQDGNMKRCTAEDFEDLQQSVAGFGETNKLAFEDYVKNLERELERFQDALKQAQIERDGLQTQLNICQKVAELRKWEIETLAAELAIADEGLTAVYLKGVADERERNRK